MWFVYEGTYSLPTSFLVNMLWLFPLGWFSGCKSKWKVWLKSLCVTSKHWATDLCWHRAYFTPCRPHSLFLDKCEQTMDYIIYLMGKGGKERNESAWKHIHINSHKKKMVTQHDRRKATAENWTREKSHGSVCRQTNTLCDTSKRQHTRNIHTKLKLNIIFYFF